MSNDDWGLDDEWGFDEDDGNANSLQSSESTGSASDLEDLWEDTDDGGIDGGFTYMGENYKSAQDNKSAWNEQSTQGYSELSGMWDQPQQWYSDSNNGQNQQQDGFSDSNGWNNQSAQGYQNQSNDWSQQQSDFQQTNNQQQPNQTANDYWQQENAKNQVQNGNTKKEFKPLSTAGVAILAFVVLFVVLLLLIGVSKVKVTKQSKPKTSTQQVAVTQQQIQQAGVDGLTLKAVPDSTIVDYSGEVIQTTGIVVAKAKYLQDSQMVYAIIINAEILGTKQEFYYYCGFDVFNGVQTSDLVQVNYQKVSKKCFSISSVIK